MKRVNLQHLVVGLILVITGFWLVFGTFLIVQKLVQAQTTGPEIELVDAGDGWYTIRIRCPDGGSPPAPPRPDPDPDPIPPPEPPPSPPALELGTWIDTGADNSLIEDDTLFISLNLDGVPAIGTESSWRNIHSHYIEATWGAPMSFSGQMLQDNVDNGVGVTFVSQYPMADHYYRLRRYGTNDFHLAPHGTSVIGDTNTGLVADAGIWYAFLVELVDTGIRTEIKAKVWKADEAEPSDWQIDCWDDTSTRLVTGSIGLWSSRPLSKFWRHLAVSGDVTPTPPPVIGAAQINWDPPTEYEDGTDLVVDHYKVYHSVTAGSCRVGSFRQTEGSSFVWSDLGAGSHFFTVSAVDGAGVESICTEEVSAVVQ